MPSWKKLITSGSDASINDLTLSGDFIAGNNSVKVLASNGRVGINTLSPSHKLTVAGNASFNEYLYHNGDTDTHVRFQTDQVDISAGGAVSTFTTSAFTAGKSITISDSTPTLNFYDTDDTEIRGFIQWDGTSGVIDSDSTLTLRANNTSGARIELTNSNGITKFYSGGTAYAQLDGGGTDLELKSLVSNATFTLRGNDGGSEIDMLAFDVAGGGDARFRQDVIAYYSSDKRLKDNIVRIENPLEKIDKIGGYTFDWNDKQETYTGKDVGVIAQEIQEVLPELVTERDNGYLAVKYEKIVPLLIESIKELKQEVDEIKQKCDCLNK